MSTLNHYRILGVSPGAGREEIRRRYRRLAWQYHPDRNPDDPEAAARFRRVVEAYEAIQETKASRPRPAAQSYRRPRSFGREEIFEEFFGIPKSGSPLQRSPGADFRYDLQISLAAALLGMETDIEVPHNLNCIHCRGTGLTPGSSFEGCPECQGRGRRFGGPGLLRFGPVCTRCQGRGKIISQECAYCLGAGHLPKKRRYHLQIPPGTRDNARLRIVGGGGEGFRHGPPGNLEVVIHVAPHDWFTRVGNDLHCQVKVSFAQAALGGMILIPSLCGYQPFDLPRGTQSGKLFRVPGEWPASSPHTEPGAIIMEVLVTTPEHLSSRQRDILEVMARLEQDQLNRAAHE